MPSRPPRRTHARLTTAQLAALVRDPATSSDVLAAISHELPYRRRARAQRLAREVSTRLLEMSPAFDWPTTNVPESSSPAAPFEIDAPDVGILRMVGYRAGLDGHDERYRRSLLTSAYEGDVPVGASPEYEASCGAPGTSQRLHKVAKCLAAQVQNMKRRRNAVSCATAIAHMENDLDWLRQTFYVGRYDFVWPSTASRRRRARAR